VGIPVEWINMASNEGWNPIPSANKTYDYRRKVMPSEANEAT